MHPEIKPYIEQLKELLSCGDSNTYYTALVVLQEHIKKNPDQFDGEVMENLRNLALASTDTSEPTHDYGEQRRMHISSADLLEEITLVLGDPAKIKMAMLCMEDIVMKSVDPVVRFQSLANIYLMHNSKNPSMQEEVIQCLRRISERHTAPTQQAQADKYLEELAPLRLKFDNHLRMMSALHRHNTWADVKDFKEELAGLQEALVGDPAILVKGNANTLEAMLCENGYHETDITNAAKTSCTKPSPQQVMSNAVIGLLETVLIDLDVPVATKRQALQVLSYTMMMSQDFALRTAALDAILCATSLLADNQELAVDLTRCLQSQAEKNNNVNLRLECREKLLPLVGNKDETVRKIALACIANGVTDGHPDVRTTTLVLMTEFLPKCPFEYVAALGGAFHHAATNNTYNKKITRLAKTGLELANERMQDGPSLKEKRTQKPGK